LLALMGVAIGLGISTAGSKILASFLSGLTSTDPLTFAGGAMILCLATIVASCVPAWRAAHLDPAVALRYE
jgi:ABC-type antimicrobial peptide transport system permease subunit